jgi:PAS domain S-box-containing protein
LSASSNINFNQLFESLAGSVTENVMVLNPADFTIKYVSHVRPGNKVEDFIGRVVFNSVYPEHIEKYKSVLNDVMASKKNRYFEVEVPDSINPGQKLYFNCNINPIINEQNQIDVLLIISKDTTIDKQRERDIANKEGRLFAIVNNTKDIILSIDRNFNITECNTVFINLIESGFGKNNLIGESVLDYIDSKKHARLIEIYNKVLLGEPIIDIESFDAPNGVLVQSNHKMYNETSYHPIFNYNNEIIGISIFSKNITDRVHSDLELKKSLKQRDILLSEIHHRIKNNLALVSSMLHLKELSTNNNEAINILAESRKRIKSTALVHEMLYRNDRFDNISLKEYIFELFNNIKINPAIELILEGDDCLLGIEKAFPFGLLMHELIMNSMKHSFSNQKNGKLKITLQNKQNFLNIEYCDCAGKFPENINFENAESTGLMLINTFVEQLNGRISLTKNEPPTYKLIIPLTQ